MLIRYKFLTVVFFTFSFSLSAQSVQEPSSTSHAEWSKSYTPFRIAGNLYYVGTYDLACYLITTGDGNILINTGLAASISQIKSNIETLGFRFTDTKLLLTTQAHYDHLGAMAAIKKATGAKIWANAPEADDMADGGRSDYTVASGISTFEPVKPDSSLNDGDTIRLGTTELIMLSHPGHTKGSCSYLLKTKDNNKEYRVLIANLPTIVTDKKFADVTAYPSIEKDYAKTFASLKSVDFDLWVASHASQFDLHTKHKPGDAYNPSVFGDKTVFKKNLQQLERQYKAHIKK